MTVQNIFYSVIQASIFGGVVGIIIYILKSTILRKLTAKWQYLLWLVMIFKLIFPNGPESKISIFNQISVVNKMSETDLLKIAQKPIQITESIQHAKAYSFIDILPYIWLAGFIITLLWIITSFIILKCKIKSTSSSPSDTTVEILNRCKEITGVHKKIKIIVQCHINSTALYGLFKSKILITKDFENMDASHIEYTFLHELSHYKRGDIAVNYLLIFLRCVHWFNPVIWFLFKKIRRDTEIATDECAMNYLSQEEHKSYGMALINTLSLKPQKLPNMLGMANNKANITKRIKAVAKFKKAGILQHIYGFLTILLVSTVSLTSAVVAKPISSTIYNSIPIHKTDYFKMNEKYQFGTENSNVPEDTQTYDDNTVEDSATVESQKSVENEYNEYEYMNTINLSIDSVVESTGQVIDNSNNTTDLTRNAKIITYNTDYDGVYTFKVKPNSGGYIQFLIENEGFNHDVYIGIYHVDSKGRGWDYCFNTKTKVPKYLDGYEPGEEYVVTISCYCPGHYNINGRILVY